jgi:hypothetical protein
MTTKLLSVVALFVGLSGAAHAAGGAPPQLVNKTIAVSWTVQNTLVTQDGRTMTPTFGVRRLIYVSTAGRLFLKFAKDTARGSREFDIEPGAATPTGGARELRFEGSKLVGTAVNKIGAGRMTISFDQAFSSCTVAVVLGRAGGGPVMRRGPRSGMVEVRAQAVSGESCSIRDGNAVAE